MTRRIWRLLALAAWGRPADSPAPAPTTGSSLPPARPMLQTRPSYWTPSRRSCSRTWLHALTRPAGAPGAVLLRADYAGKIVEGAAEFDAAFQAYCFTDETTTLTFPLDGVQLTGDVLLDGAPVRAAALPAPKAGFTIPIAGRSKAGEPPHKVELHFRTPVTGTAEGRNVQFTVPRLAQCHLLLRLPKGSAYIQALVKYGVQKPADGDPFSLDVELGRVAAPLHVRWVPETPGAAKPRPPEVRLKEAYLWDLRLDSSSLTAFLSYTISPEGTTSLAVEGAAGSGRAFHRQGGGLTTPTPLRLRALESRRRQRRPYSANGVCHSGKRRFGDIARNGAAVAVAAFVRPAAAFSDPSRFSANREAGPGDRLVPGLSHQRLGSRAR